MLYPDGVAEGPRRTGIDTDGAPVAASIPLRNGAGPSSASTRRATSRRIATNDDMSGGAWATAPSTRLNAREVAAARGGLIPAWRAANTTGVRSPAAARRAGIASGGS